MDHRKQDVKRIKVAYLSLLPEPGTLAGSGVPKVSETLLAEFESRNDIQVSAFGFIDNLKEDFSSTKGSVTYHYLKCPAKGKTATLYAREVTKLKAILRGQSPDIVHGQPTSEYLLAASTSRFPHVLTIHGLVLRETKGLSFLHPGFLANVVRETLQRRAIRRSAHVISISPYVEDYVSKLSSAAIHPVPNPIDPEFFDLAPPVGDTLKILCVGLVSVRKNQKLLIEACRLLKSRGIGFECRIVGKVDPVLRQELQSAIRSGQLDGLVTIEGLVSTEALLASYAWANVVVLPSREETAPLSLIQALAAGRPVMGAKSAGIPSLLENGKRGRLFDPESADELAGALEKFSTRIPVEIDRVRDTASWARNQFHPASVADATIRVYREIMSRSTHHE